MTQIYTILFDLDGTISGYSARFNGSSQSCHEKIWSQSEKKLSDIKSLAGKGAWVMMQRSFKNEIKDEKIKKENDK